METITVQKLEAETTQRLNEMKDNKIESFTEDDYKKLIKKKGI